MANPVPPPLGSNRLSAPGAAPAGGSGPVAPPLGPNVKGQAAASPKSGGGLFGSLGHFAGGAFGVVRAVPSLVGTLATKGGSELYHSFKDTNETQAALHPAEALKNNSVFSKQGRATAAQNFPLTYGALASIGTTARQIPDTAVAVAPGGAGFGKSSLGQQIKHQGVLNTGLAKVGDLSVLLGGAGLVGKAAGAGRLAEVARLGEVADASLKAAGLAGKVETAADASRLATAAAGAGDVERAANLSKIAETLSAKEGLLAQGPATAAERATALAAKGGHLGARVAGGPAEVYTKPLGLLAKGAMKIEPVANAVEHLGEAARESKLGQAVEARRVLKQATAENITGEQARLNHEPLQAMKAAKAAVGGDATSEAAVILDRMGTARAAGQHLAGLTDDELKTVLGVHGTPEAFKLAQDYAAGHLAPEQAAALDAAGQHLEQGVFAPKQQRFLTGYGELNKPSPATLESRAAEVANPHEPSPMGLTRETLKRQEPVLRRTERVTRRITDQMNKLDETAPSRSVSDERLVAGKDATRKSIERHVAKEAARSDRLAGTVLREQARNAETEASRTGQVMGRAKERLETRDQLDTGVEARAKRAAQDARRLEKGAAKAETAGAAARTESFAAKGERVTPATVRANATEAVRQSAADEARTAADQLKGVKGPRSRGEVQSDVSRDSRLANEASKIEARQTERHLSGEATRQGAAQASAERQAQKASKLYDDAVQRTQARAEDRLQRQKDRLGTRLAETRAKTTAKLGEVKATAAESLAAAPAASRATLLQMRDMGANLHKLADEADAAGDTAKAINLRARADALPTTLAELKAQGVTPKYVYGGAEGEAAGGSKAAPKLQGRGKLASSRLRETGTAPLSFEGQAQKALENVRGTARNEFSPKLAAQLGNTTSHDIASTAGLSGRELGQALRDEGYTPWDPNGTGRKIPEAQWDTLKPGVDIIPKAYGGRVDQLVRVPKGEAETLGQMLKKSGLAAMDKTSQAGRFAKLLEPGWQVKKTLGDPAMLAAMGVGPADIATHLGEAAKAVREGNLTPHLGASAEGRMAMDQPTSKLAGAARKGANAVFKPFQTADALAREIAYRAKVAEGLSPQAAAAAVRRGLGDLHDMTAAEANVARRVFTFYPWQKHVAQTLLRLPLEHPAGLAQAAHLQQLAGGTENPNQLEASTNPFNSSVLSMIHESAPDRQTGAVGSQVNPVVRALFGGVTGTSPSRGFSPISTPGQKFGAGPQLGFALKHPGEFAKFVGHMLPPVVTAQNLLNTAPAPGGKLPQRFETGEPIRHGTKNTGTPKAATAGPRTKAQAAKAILGIEPPAPKKKAKK